ncbi:MAG: hypothetical protein WBX19_00805 [Terracidiphilus sp.]
MSASSICFTDSAVQITGVELHHPDVVQYFHTVEEEDLERAFERAVEVGTFCLQRASACQDFDFVRRQVARS